MLPHLTFVLGGAASGKSRFAEQIVMAQDAPRIYLATSQAFDAEMDDKIARHKAQRGDGWITIEEPLNVADVLAQQPSDHIVLVDCATLWLTNVILADLDVAEHTTAFCDALVNCPL